jgi:hypothetical protein
MKDPLRCYMTVECSNYIAFLGLLPANIAYQQTLKKRSTCFSAGMIKYLWALYKSEVMFEQSTSSIGTAEDK